MKILILSCNTGQGHNSAASAVAEQLERLGIECVIEDTFSFLGEKSSDYVSKIYCGMTVKLPWVFESIYKVSTRISSKKRKSPVYYANCSCAKKIEAYIKENEIDGVITPHIFSTQIMSYLKEKKKLSIPCFAVATDYACTPFWEETMVDYYFIPHLDLMGEFIQKGMPEEKLIATGIPTSEQFQNKKTKEEARRELNLPLDSKVFLIMTGSMGFGDMSSLVAEMTMTYPTQARIIIMTGRNEKLQNKLEKQFWRDERVIPVPFTKQVALYMDGCDVLLTKPGGLTSTEAAVKRLPLILTPPIPGCETHNARFFEEHGLAICVNNTQETVARAWELSQNETGIAKMEANQQHVICANAAQIISLKVKEIVEESELISDMEKQVV